MPEIKSEKTRTYFTFGLAAAALIGGFVLVFLGKFDELEAFASVAGVALGSDAVTSLGYTVSRTLKKNAESKAEALKSMSTDTVAVKAAEALAANPQ